jgi:hypothetical protein
MRTDKPLLISIAEASFQLSLPEEDILTLVRDGELVAVRARDQVLVVYESLSAFTRRAKRNDRMRQIPEARLQFCARSQG